MIESKIPVTDFINNYGMIVGHDMLQELGIVLHFGDLAIAWDHAITAMKNHNSIEHNNIVAVDSDCPAVVDATNLMKQILEAKYKAANIKNVVVGCKHHSAIDQKQLLLFSPDLNHCFMEHLEIGKMKRMTSH
jgi:hypothetical protein